MNIGCQSVINIERPEQGTADLRNAGINRVFLSIYVRFPQQESGEKAEKAIKKYSPVTIKERYETVVKKCIDKGIHITFIKAPIIPRTLDIYSVLPILQTAITQCLELCRMAKCGFLLIELPIQFKGNYREVQQTVYDYCLAMAKKAWECGVTLLLKNQIRDIGGHLVRGFCAEASDAVKWVDSLNNKLGYNAFGFCVDMGICNLCGNDIQAYINTLGSRIKVVILRDNDGRNDISLLPFTYADSGTDWLGVIRGLRDINFDGELVVDFSSTYSSFSPLIRPTLFKLAKEIGDYFQWQIEIENNLKKHQKFVLFGAGNMCRNYMKCYGEKYPPLFTCDNNPKLWGTAFEGLEVKNPEILRELPKDCCVVICNIYYREIEVQLREMGIENIGYFNDEYMPSFYFDRLDNE